MFLFSPYFLDFDGNINRHPAAYYLLSLQYNKPLTKSVLFSDEILRGLVTDSAQKVDMIFTQTVGEQHNQYIIYLFGQHQRCL